MTDLEKAFKKLNYKQKLGTLFQYYDGDQPLVYSAARLREVFKDNFAKFDQNWCSVVVNATLDRINLKGFNVINDVKINQKLNELFVDNNLQLDAIDVHKNSLIAGESYIIAWKNAAGEMEIYQNPPYMCHLFYREDAPKIKRFAVKWFKGEDDEKWHITLYYADHLEYFVSKGKDIPGDAKGFEKEKPNASNPFGIVPVFHFKCPSDLKDIITNQDAINKLFADEMVAGEFGAFKQRWVISNADITDLKNAPNEVWGIPAGDKQSQDTSVGEFNGEDLAKFYNAIEKVANFIAINTRTPRHYLSDVGAGISGDALIAMEAPLVKKVEQRIQQFTITWQELALFLLQLDNPGAGAYQSPIKKSQIMPIWGRVKSEQPIAEMQSINFGTSSGIALVTMLRRMGWGKDEIDQALKDIDEQKERNNNLATNLLEKARNATASNNDNGYPAGGANGNS